MISQGLPSLPVVAIVGRPNVGKSSLLNCLVGHRVSIVESTPGVTRDRVSSILPHKDVVMELVDTGGIGIAELDDVGEHVERQIRYAVRDANLILFVTDVRDGVTPLDREVARRLREQSAAVPVLLVVNKVDAPGLEGHAGEFHALGMGDPLLVSARESFGKHELLDQVVEKLWPTGDVDTEPVMRIAVVGRQNVGKSTFVNALVEEERVIVSEVPGTTRDAVDVMFEKDGRRFVLIDTAGVKRRRRKQNRIEYYSFVRMQDAVRRAHVVLFLLDAMHEVTRADKRLGSFIGEQARICIVVANKWDLVRGGMAAEQFAEYVAKVMPGLRYAPMTFTTAKDARNTQATIGLAQNLFKRAARRIGTGELNRVVDAIREHHPPRPRRSKVPKIFYCTQVGVVPPTFVMFVNDPRLFEESYRRYIAGAFREVFDFDEIPLRIFFRARERRESPAK